MEQQKKSVEQNREDILLGYVPIQCSLHEIRNAIPSRLFVQDIKIGIFYTARDLIMAVCLLYGATFIGPLVEKPYLQSSLTPTGAGVVRWFFWGVYWYFQGLTLTGLWVIGHECGHGAFSPSKSTCNILGYALHTALWTPYFSWKISHHRHHCNNASMEKDEVYVPHTRSDLGIPDDPVNYEEYFADAPIYTTLKLIRQQLLGFPAYLLCNVSGQRNFPKGTNHFHPNSVIFTPRQWNAVILSDAGIIFMVWLVMYASSVFGTINVVKYYFVPWLTVTHWIVMVTYLQHTHPRLPHFRKKEWTFQRGAACTVDRNFLGWQGRFFLHNVAHYHVIHHFFPKIPFYHAAEATKVLKQFMGPHYFYSDAPVFQTLWETYDFCRFVEDKGDIVFYKNREGKAAVRHL